MIYTYNATKQSKNRHKTGQSQFPSALVLLTGQSHTMIKDRSNRQSYATLFYVPGSHECHPQPRRSSAADRTCWGGGHLHSPASSATGTCNIMDTVSHFYTNFRFKDFFVSRCDFCSCVGHFVTQPFNLILSNWVHILLKYSYGYPSHALPYMYLTTSLYKDLRLCSKAMNTQIF